jgi:excisionase family DNA binding protein
MPLTLGQAALQAGRSKPTILKALKTGRLSGVKVGNEWQIEPAELFRAYPQTTTVNTNTLPLVNPPENTIETAVLRAKLEAAEQQIQDLKEDRDQWRQAANRLLSNGAAPLATPPEGRGRGFFASLFGRK